jgi:hypothetical protein
MLSPQRLLLVSLAHAAAAPADAQPRRKRDRVLERAADRRANARHQVLVLARSDLDTNLSVAGCETSLVPTLPPSPKTQFVEFESTLTCSTTIDAQWRATARNIVWGHNVVCGNTVYYNLPTWNLLRQRAGDGTLGGANIVSADASGLNFGQYCLGDDIVWSQNIASAIEPRADSRSTTRSSGETRTTSCGRRHRLGQRATYRAERESTAMSAPTPLLVPTTGVSTD